MVRTLLATAALALTLGTATLVQPSGGADDGPSHVVGFGQVWWAYPYGDPDASEGTSPLVVELTRGVGAGDAFLTFHFSTVPSVHSVLFPTGKLGSAGVDGAWDSAWRLHDDWDGRAQLSVGPLGDGSAVEFHVFGGIVTGTVMGGDLDAPWKVDGTFEVSRAV